MHGKMVFPQLVVAFVVVTVASGWTRPVKTSTSHLPSSDCV